MSNAETSDATSRSDEAQPSPWAAPVSRLKVASVPAGAINLNVEGRRIVGPLQGFGQLWQKTYRIRLRGASVAPTELVRVWKARFPEFWPRGNRFYAPFTGINPGDVAVLNLSMPGGVPLSTGIIVIYADDVSFSFMNPQGHMFGGMITFSAHEDNGETVAQIQPLIRANDPAYELGCRVGVGHWLEDRFWKQTLRNLAASFGAAGEVEQETVLVDPSVQWSEARNIWHNALVRTSLYLSLTPFRWIRSLMPDRYYPR